MNMYLHHGMSVYFGEALEKIGEQSARSTSDGFRWRAAHL